MAPKSKMVHPPQQRIHREPSPASSTDSDMMRKQTLERISKSFEKMSKPSHQVNMNEQFLLTDLKPTLMNVLSEPPRLVLENEITSKEEELYDELELKSFTTSTQSSSSRDSDDIPSPSLFPQSRQPKTSIISLDESESDASEDSEIITGIQSSSKLEAFIVPRSATRNPNFLPYRNPALEDASDRSHDSDKTPITNPRLVVQYDEAPTSQPKTVTARKYHIQRAQIQQKVKTPEENKHTGFHKLCTIAKGEEDPRWNILFTVLRTRVTDEMKRVVESKEHGVIPLCLLCRQQPPIHIIQAMVSISPKSVYFSDENGFLPLHIACACGASEEVIRVLVDVDANTKESLTNSNKTPLHLWMYKHQYNLPSIENFKLLVTPQVMESADNHGNTPFTLYHDFVKQVRGSGVYDQYLQKENCKEFFDAYLDTRPLGKSDLIKEISRFPLWLQDHALTHHNLRRILNFRIAQRSLSFIIFLDLIIQIMLIITFMVAMNSFTFLRDTRQVTNTVFLSLGIAYTICRSLFHLVSFNITTFLFNLWNILDLTQIVFLILSVDSLNRNASISPYDSIIWTTTGGLLWVRAVSLLNTTFLPFSIFISGFVRVFLILIPIMITTLCLMTGMALMFFTRINTFLETSMLCGNQMKNDAFCSLSGSWVETFHMMFGLENEYSEFVIDNNRVLFSLFSFVVGIMFIFIVIAIVNESFGKVISAGHRAFWRNRLEFIYKTDTFSEFWFGPLESEKHYSNIQKSTSNEAFSEKNYLLQNKYGEQSDRIDSMRLLWDIATSAWVSHDKPDKLNGEEELLRKLKIFDQVMQDNLLSRRIMSISLIPPWLAIGLVSVGLLWPPQVREFLLCPSLENTAEKKSKSELLLEKVQQEMKELLLEVNMNKVSNRLQSLEDESKQIAVEMFQTKTDVGKEMNALKELLIAIDKKL